LQEIAEKAEKEKTSTTINADTLTLAGAKLYRTVVAAIHVVEAALTGQTPSLEDLQKMRQEANKIEVIPGEITLRPGEKTIVQMSRGGPLTAFASSNDETASVRLINATTAEITAEKEAKDNEATITFANDRGGSAVVKVTVKQVPEPSPPS